MSRATQAAAGVSMVSLLVLASALADQRAGRCVATMVGLLVAVCWSFVVRRRSVRFAAVVFGFGVVMTAADPQDAGSSSSLPFPDRYRRGAGTTTGRVNVSNRMIKAASFASSVISVGVVVGGLFAATDVFDASTVAAPEFTYLATTTTEGKAGPVPFETVYVAGNASTNLVPGISLRVESGWPVEHTIELLGLDAESDLGAGIVAAVGRVPNDHVAIVGLVDWACRPSQGPDLVRSVDGVLTMWSPNPNQPPECYVMWQSLAVLSVHVDDAPFGSTDPSMSVYFGRVDDEFEFGAVEITESNGDLVTLVPRFDATVLPPVESGDRRFAFVLGGCGNTAAELIVTRQLVDANLGHQTMLCDAPEGFLAVFDVQADLLWDDVTLGTTR